MPRDRAIFDAKQFRPVTEHALETREQFASLGRRHRLPTVTILRDKCIKKSSDLRVQGVVLSGVFMFDSVFDYSETF